MTDLRDRAIELYDAFTHEHRDRRTLLRQMTALAGSVAAAEALIGGIAASPAAAALVDPADARLQLYWYTSKTGKAGTAVRFYIAFDKTIRQRSGVVIVVHENRGLTPHIQDVTRRLALAGFFAIAPDLLAPQGGTPGDEDRARALIGTIDYDLALGQTTYLAQTAATFREANGRVGMVGFCWGGALVNRLALADKPAFAAAVSYYGPAPSASEAAKLMVPIMLHYAGKDARVAATGEPWVAALEAAGKPVEAFTYPGVDHAFNNDTSTERYDKPAADLAWERTIRFLHERLDA